MSPTYNPRWLRATFKSLSWESNLFWNRVQELHWNFLVNFELMVLLFRVHRSFVYYFLLCPSIFFSRFNGFRSPTRTRTPRDGSHNWNEREGRSHLAVILLPLQHLRCKVWMWSEMKKRSWIRQRCFLSKIFIGRWKIARLLDEKYGTQVCNKYTQPDFIMSMFLF